MSTADALYTADDLTALEGLDAVRKRPGMYIGSTDSRGMTHLVYEIIDNSVDEALAGHCTTINITLHPDGSVEVTDNGRGIPTDINTKTGLSGIELVLTKLHAGGKFGGSGYKSAGGLHGVGSSVVNALSTRLDATVLRNGKHHKLSFQRGTPGQFTGTTPTSTFTPGNTLTITPAKHKTATGTTIRFWPDPQVFLTDAHIDTDAVTARAQQTAFLVPGLTLTLTLPDHDTQTFHYDGGVVDMVEYLAPDTAVCDPIVITGTGTYDETVPMLNSDGHMVNTTITRTVELTAALRWGTGYDTRIESFVNVVRTPYGGSHKKAFEKALTKTLNDALKNTRGLLKPGDEPPTLDDITEGLTAVISVNVPEPQFVGQTKDELGTAGVTKPITHLVTTATKHWLDDRRKKTQVRTILEKIAAATKVRQQQRAAKEAARRKTALEGASMPAKLVDCRSTGVDRSELFIVEGDSALGCFTGDTLVATAEGRPLTFAQLAQDWAKGIVHFGYATNKAGDVNVAPLIEPRVTKTAHALVRVTLDNGESVRCTPDHLFRLRDGSYLRADELQPGQSLMPLYRKASAKRLGDKLNGYYGNDIAQVREAAATINHKVSSVEAITATEEVYDLTVEGYHNFALEAGVFVHNSARGGRYSEYQALLPIRGKILNVQKASLKQVLDNAECASIIQVVGAGSGRTFDVDQMRYGRLIVMADADVDGAHIRVLLITLVYRYMRPIIEEGRLFAAMPPLHKITVKGKGGDVIYTYTQAEMEETVARLEAAGKSVVSPVPRYKGLGEMNASELWETTMDPTTRSVRRITLADAEAAEATLELLLGNKVEPRREFLIANSDRVDREDLDV